MSKNTALTIISLLMFGGFMFVTYNSPHLNSTKVASFETKTKSSIQARSILLEEVNNSGQNGVALINFNTDKTKIQINLSNSFEDSYYASIFSGNCEKKGEKIEDLNEVINGTSTTELNLRIPSDTSISIFKSKNDPTSIISCGNILQ